MNFTKALYQTPCKNFDCQNKNFDCLNKNFQLAYKIRYQEKIVKSRSDFSSMNIKSDEWSKKYERLPCS